MNFNLGDHIEVSVPIMNSGSAPVDVDVYIVIIENWPIEIIPTKVYTAGVVPLSLAAGETKQAVISYVDNDQNATGRDVAVTILLTGAQNQVGQTKWSNVYSVGAAGTGVQWWEWLLIGGGVAVAGYAAVKIFGKKL